MRRLLLVVAVLAVLSWFAVPAQAHGCRRYYRHHHRPQYHAYHYYRPQYHAYRYYSPYYGGYYRSPYRYGYGYPQSGFYVHGNRFSIGIGF